MPTQTDSLAVIEATNLKKISLGPLDATLKTLGDGIPGFVDHIPGKVFLKERLGLTGMEASVNAMLPGEGIPFLHKHKRNEELFVVLRGRGQFMVDGAVHELTEGDALRVAPDGARAIRNPYGEPLVFLVVQAQEGSLGGWTADDGVPLEAPLAWE